MQMSLRFRLRFIQFFVVFFLFSFHFFCFVCQFRLHLSLSSQLQCAICYYKTFVLLLLVLVLLPLLLACHIIIFRLRKNLTRVMICM